MNCWLVLAAMLCSSLVAQEVTNAPPAPPVENPAPAAAVTNTPSAKSTKKKSAPRKKKSSVTKRKNPAAELRTVPLNPGPAVVDAHNVNVRGQAKLHSEVVARLTNGQPVMVLEEITRNNSAPDEPSAWAKITLPPNTHVWVNTSFIDAANKTVRPKRLNFRAGPGENYSVLGRLERGDTVNETGTKGDWTEIEAPTNAYAFVAAQYLKQEAPGAVAPVVPETAPATVAEPPAIAAAPVDATVTNTPADSSTTNEISEATTTNTPPALAADEPPPKRIVEREGLVRGTFSVQAPTHFELISTENGRTIDFLYTTSPNLDLRRYKGLKIVVTGEEALDERWGNTPVITIQKIQVLE